ncbi:HAD-IA family hydrolase [Oscillospiraceae bacterium HV4-5-C5C]|nr:HAD-IA family hydrolase [Oscillospiraceae bacterium HV4-5-C5C]
MLDFLPEAAVFDLDGTLLNTLEDLTGAVNHALAAAGLQPLPAAYVRLMVGQGISRLLHRAYVFSVAGREKPAAGTPLTAAQLTDLDLTVADQPAEEQLAQSFYQSYGEHCLDRTRPYAGIAQVLTAWHEQGVKLAVLSNKEDHLASRIIHYYFGRQLFDQVSGLKYDWPAKPDPASTLATLEHLGARPRASLFIGDSATDIQTARQAGCYPIGVCWGFRSAQELQQAGAAVLMQQPEDLMTLLPRTSRPIKDKRDDGAVR